MKTKFLHIFLLFSAVFTYGQVNLWTAVEERNLKVNDDFVVTFILEVNGNDYVQETPLRLPDLSKYNILGQGSDTKTYIDPKSNIAINQIVYQVALQPKQAGKNRIGSALVQVNGKMYKTEPIDFYVAEADKKTPQNQEIASSPADFYLDMQVKKREVYANQPTIAILRAYSKDFDNFRKVSDIEVPEQPNISIRTVSHRKSDIEQNSKGDMASQVIAVYMVFPTEPGKVEIEPVTAKLKDKKYSSNKVNLNVKKLPGDSPADFKNAVGAFTMDIEKIPEEKIVENKPINVTVKIKGEGNLQNMKLPKIVPNDSYSVFPPKITREMTTGKDGLQGEITAHYVILPVKTGKISVETEGFAYFNPHDKKYVEEGSKMINLNVMSHEELLDSKTTIEKVNDNISEILETVGTPVIGNSALKEKEKSRFDWKTILLNTAVFTVLAFLIFYLKKARKKRKSAKENIPTEPIQTIEETERILRQSQKISVEDHLHYLKTLKDNKDSRQFFNVYDELLKDVENQMNEKGFSSFGAYLEQAFGKQESENFRNLSKKIALEKYAPVSADEDLEEFYNEIDILFSKITK
ncbi:MAG: BatD family protein [Bergeyella sp.]